MSSLLLSFGPAWVQLGLVLAHFLWQGAAIALLLAGVLFLLRRRSPNVRYTACGLAMLLMAASPIATVCYVRSHPLPALVVGELPLSPRSAPAMIRSVEPSSVVRDTRETIAPVEAPVAFSTSVRHDGSTMSMRQGAVTERALPSPSRIEGTTVNHPPGIPVASVDLGSRPGWYGLGLKLVAVGWSLGVLAMSARLLAGWFGLRRLFLGQSEPLSGVAEDLVRQMRRRLGLGDRTKVLATRAWREPVAFGLLKPVVLLPLSMLTQHPTEVLEAMIAHELAHVRRYDLWVNVLQRVVEAVLFYHPAVWWASGRMRLERELCCDDLAIRVTGRRAEYASALVELCRAWQGSMTPVLAAGMFGPRLTMMTRVRRVLRMPATRDESSRSGFLLAGPLSVVLAGTFILAASLKATGPGGAPAASSNTTAKPVAVSVVPPTTSAPTVPMRPGATNRTLPLAMTPAARSVATRPAHPSDSRSYDFAWEQIPISDALQEFQQKAGLSMPNLGRALDETGVAEELVCFRSVRPMSFDDALLMVNHLIEGRDLWIVRQEQYLDIRTLDDWQLHIPASNRFSSEAAFRQARIPQWDVASVIYQTGYASPEPLIEFLTQAVPLNAAVARAYPETGRIELAGVVQYVEQMLEAVKQHEGEGGASTVTVPTTAAPGVVSGPVGVASSGSPSAAPRRSILDSREELPARGVSSAEPMSSLVAEARQVGQADPRLGILTIRSQADGVVAEILVKDGQQVRAGDLVARLDSEEIKLELAAAELRYSSAAPLAKLAKGKHEKGLIAEEEMRKAESEAGLAEIDLRRCQLRLKRTEIRSTWDGKICGDRYTRTLGATNLLALVGKRVVAGDPVVEILVTAPSSAPERRAETEPAANPPEYKYITY